MRVLAPPRGWLSIDWAELWRYRELLYFIAWRDVKVRYKQTILGVLWAFIQPFLKLVVFTVIFGKLAKVDSEGYPYAIFLYAGLLPWQFFQEALSRSSGSVVAGSNLISKVYFPRLIMPIAATGACLVDFVVSFVILLGLMVYYSVPLSVQIVAFIPLVVLTVVAALGVGVLLSALTAAYRDFQYVVGFLLQIWMYVTPVIYPVSFVPEKWRWLLALNPMTGVVDAYRSAILGKPFDWVTISISFGVAAVVLFAGLRYFRRVEVRFADIV